MAAILKVKDSLGNVTSIPAIKGDKGDPGNPGVYVGSDTPDGYSIYINPNVNSVDQYMTRSQVEQLIDEKIAASTVVATASMFSSIGTTFSAELVNENEIQVTSTGSVMNADLNSEISDQITTNGANTALESNQIVFEEVHS